MKLDVERFDFSKAEDLVRFNNLLLQVKRSNPRCLSIGVDVGDLNPATGKLPETAVEMPMSFYATYVV